MGSVGSYIETHPEMKRMVRKLRSDASFVAFEVFAPPTFGSRVYMAELFKELSKKRSENGSMIFKRIKYRVEETDDPRKAARAYLESQLKPDEDGRLCRYIVEVHNLDRRSDVDFHTAEAALRGLDDAIEPYEENLVNNTGVGLVLCTQTRQRGRHPLCSEIKVSVIDRKIEMAYAVRLYDPETTTDLILSATAEAAAPARVKFILARASGGHPLLIKAAVDLLNFEPDLTPEEYLVRLTRVATAVFTNIWENTEQHERLLLFAAAAIQCVELETPLDAPSIWSKGVSKGGWNKIANVTGAFKYDLEDLKILRIGSDDKPEVFTPLFAVWLVQFAHALRIPSKESIEDMLQIAIEHDKPSYATVLEQLWSPVAGRLREKGTVLLADTILSGSVKAISNLIVQHLSI